MRFVVGGIRLVLSVGVLGCIALSSFFAFEFGWTKGATPQHAWAFALTAAFLDLLKSGILPLTADAPGAQRRAGYAAFFFLTVMSLWAAYGTTATQLAERISTKVVAATVQASKQATLDRLKAQRAALPQFVETSEQAVETAKAAVSTASARAAEENKRGGCGTACKAWERDEQTARAALLKAQTDRALTIKGADLDTKIAAAEEALSRVDVRAATRQVDPQTENMAKVAGISEEVVALISHTIFAVGIEIGSGLGFWLIFGHGRREADVHLEPARPASTALVPITPTPLVETPASVRERFFDRVVLPSPPDRIAGTTVYLAYARWCMENGFMPMSQHAFGRDPPWPKERRGGVIWYLGCRLAEGYGPQLRLVANG